MLNFLDDVFLKSQEHKAQIGNSLVFIEQELENYKDPKHYSYINTLHHLKNHIEKHNTECLTLQTPDLLKKIELNTSNRSLRQFNVQFLDVLFLLYNQTKRSYFIVVGVEKYSQKLWFLACPDTGIRYINDIQNSIHLKAIFKRIARLPFLSINLYELSLKHVKNNLSFFQQKINTLPDDIKEDLNYLKCSNKQEKYKLILIERLRLLAIHCSVISTIRHYAYLSSYLYQIILENNNNIENIFNNFILYIKNNIIDIIKKLPFENQKEILLEIAELLELKQLLIKLSISDDYTIKTIVEYKNLNNPSDINKELEILLEYLNKPCEEVIRALSAILQAYKADMEKYREQYCKTSMSTMSI